MKVMNLMTYEQYLNNTKGYKSIGINYYYNYCSVMDAIYIEATKNQKDNIAILNFDKITNEIFSIFTSFRNSNYKL